MAQPLKENETRVTYISGRKAKSLSGAKPPKNKKKKQVYRVLT
jgi:hypothetical protein